MRAEYKYASRKKTDGTFLDGKNVSGDDDRAFYLPTSNEILNGLNYSQSKNRNDFLWWYRNRYSSNGTEKTVLGYDDTDWQISKLTGIDFGSERRHHLSGGKKPNHLGLYDMAGNVMEWCFDIKVVYGSKLKFSNQRYCRGGEVFNDFSSCPIRSAYPSAAFPSCTTICGFRLARNL